MGKTIIFIAEIAILALLGFICSELYLLKNAVPLGEEAHLSVSALQPGDNDVIYSEEITINGSEHISYSDESPMNPIPATLLPPESEAPSPSGESSQKTTSPEASEENAQQS